MHMLWMFCGWVNTSWESCSLKFDTQLCISFHLFPIVHFCWQKQAYNLRHMFKKTSERIEKISGLPSFPTNLHGARSTISLKQKFPRMRPVNGWTQDGSGLPGMVSGESSFLLFLSPCVCVCGSCFSSWCCCCNQCWRCCRCCPGCRCRCGEFFFVFVI